MAEHIIEREPKRLEHNTKMSLVFAHRMLRPKPMYGQFVAVTLPDVWMLGSSVAHLRQEVTIRTPAMESLFAV